MEKKVKILAVDDSPGNLIALEAVFSGTNYELVEAHSGFEALKILEEESGFAVILLDVQMPVMDGYETATRIKQMNHYQDVPIIFITAVFREDPFVLRGYEVGAIDYFSKPFDPAILKAKVNIYSAHQQKNILLRERELRILETEKLLEAGKKLSSLLETLPVGVLISDIDGKICQINEEVSRILGGTFTGVNDEYGAILGWWDKSGNLIKTQGGPLERALHLGESSRNEVIVIRGLDGHEKTIYASASPLRALDGHIVGAGVVIQDKTESKKIEKDLEDRVLDLINIGVGLSETSTTPN